MLAEGAVGILVSPAVKVGKAMVMLPEVGIAVTVVKVMVCIAVTGAEAVEGREVVMVSLACDNGRGSAAAAVSGKKNLMKMRVNSTP